MVTIVKYLLTFLLVFSFVSCQNKNQPVSNKEKKKEQQKDTITGYYNKPMTTNDSVFSNNYSYYGDSLFKLHKKILAYYFKKYDSNSCNPVIYSKKDLKEVYEGFKNVGDLNHNHQKDSVFVVNPLNTCEENIGQSYYFTDTTLPRLQTDSHCCHPSSIFSIGDIDEDGTDEIGQYYSSCVSRYKSLIVYSLKNGEWKQIGRCVYDLMYSKYEANYKSYIKKLKKDSFAMLEITDLDTAYIGRQHWIKFDM
jgi:hypothetical protein